MLTGEKNAFGYVSKKIKNITDQMCKVGVVNSKIFEIACNLNKRPMAAASRMIHGSNGCSSQNFEVDV